MVLENFSPIRCAESVAEEKKTKRTKKKVGKPIGDPVRTGYPNKKVYEI